MKDEILQEIEAKTEEYKETLRKKTEAEIKTEKLDLAHLELKRDFTLNPSAYIEDEIGKTAELREAQRRKYMSEHYKQASEIKTEFIKQQNHLDLIKQQLKYLYAKLNNIELAEVPAKQKNKTKKQKEAEPAEKKEPVEYISNTGKVQINEDFGNILTHINCEFEKPNAIHHFCSYFGIDIQNGHVEKLALVQDYNRLVGMVDEYLTALGKEDAQIATTEQQQVLNFSPEETKKENENYNPYEETAKLVAQKNKFIGYKLDPEINKLLNQVEQDDEKIRLAQEQANNVQKEKEKFIVKTCNSGQIEGDKFLPEGAKHTISKIFIQNLETHGYIDTISQKAFMDFYKIEYDNFTTPIRHCYLSTLDPEIIALMAEKHKKADEVEFVFE